MIIFTKKKNTYRIPLRLILDLGLINFAMKTNTKIIITERSLNKLFETTKKAASIPDEPDASINFHDRLYISYQEINLTKTMDIYLKGVLRSEQALRMGVLPSPYQQLFEINKKIQFLAQPVNLNMILKMRMKKIFFTICLLLIIVIAVVQLH